MSQQQQQLPFVPALKLVAEEVAKDVSKFDLVLPSASLRVEASQQCIVDTALRLAKKCKRGTRHLCVRDVERAIEMETGETPLYFTSETEKALDAQPKSTSQPVLQVYYDMDVQLKDFVQQQEQQIPKVPIAPTYTVNWLAVDGVQPNIPENQVKSASGTAALLAATETNNTGAKKRALEQEDVAVMTRELQLYYDKTLQVLLEAEISNGGGEQAVRRVLNSIANDAGIDRLVPHFVAFICQRVKDLAATTTTTALPGLWTAVRLAHALITNESLKNVELYLHDLLPSLLTCVVAQSLCAASLSSSQDHWSLRDFAAGCVALVCKKFAETYVGLHQRVCKVFTNALESNTHALTSRYGGICGLAALGPGTVDSLLVPYLVCNPQFIAQLEAAMEEESEFEETEQEFVTRIEAFRVFHALRQALVQTKQLDANKAQLLNALGYEQHAVVGFMELW